MSLGLPTIRAKDEVSAHDKSKISGDYEVIQHMNTGLASSVRDQNASSTHPLQHSVEHYWEQKESLEFVTARNMQGLHMPMRLGMERFAAKKVGRLPCMATKTSNLMLDTLTGRDETIDVDDVFNCPSEYPERCGNIHAIMEKKLGIL